MPDTPATWGGWGQAIRDDPFGQFAEARARCPVQRVHLADGYPAWLVLGYDAARRALNDPRISKDMLAALEDNADSAWALTHGRYAWPGAGGHGRTWRCVV